MDRTTTTFGSTIDANNNADPVTSKVEATAQAAHLATDKVADKVIDQVGRLSGTAHRAVNNAADTATAATDWASTIPEQAKQAQSRLTESACASLRANPIASMAGVLAVGYLLGRLARP